MIQRNVKSTAKPLKSTQPKRSKAELQRGIVAKLRVRGIADPARATNEEMYLAVVSTLKEMIAENRNSFKKRAAAKESKKVCYLCMEFLIGIYPVDSFKEISGVSPIRSITLST